MSTTQRKITDYTIVRKFLKFEQDMLKLLQNVPSKFKFSLSQQIVEQLGNAKRLLVMVMDMPRNMTPSMKEAKYNMLVEARGELRVVEVDICQLNDLNGISNNTLVVLYGQLHDVFQNFDRLLCSLYSQYTGDGGSDSLGYAPETASAIVRTPYCVENENLA